MLKIDNVQTEKGRVRRFCINDREYIVGSASSDGHNCLIDTLRQQLGMIVSVEAVREVLKDTFTDGPDKVEAYNFLDLEAHWEKVVSTLGELWGSATFTGRRLKIVCIDLDSIEGTDGAWQCDGNVVGTGDRKLYIARQDRNHFVPLLRKVR